LPFLHELAQVVPSAATFKLVIAGDLQLEAAYARDCLALCEQHPWLRDHVSFLGSVSQSELFARLERASVLVSASRMESYGMALAEARALGTPILALPGGNIAHHVAADSGGELAGTPRALAQALCALTADPAELEARLVRARATASLRPWSAAAADFIELAVEARER
jgi:glycosyltransferase involved in cell wall biosynthesis